MDYDTWKALLQEHDDNYGSYEDSPYENPHEEEEEDDEEIIEYEMECPECGKPVVLDEETIEEGEIICPHCRQKLTIDIGFEDDEEE